jgi:predicted dehydrogenase
MPKTRLALVGAGWIAQSYAQVLLESETAELVAVADTDLDAASRLADTFGCRVFDSHSSLLRWGDFDAALVCTPPSSHAFIVLELLRAGIHVLCEKPLSVDVASARRMLHVADRMGVRLTMASKFRYVGDVIQAKAFITSGVLGEVLAFENTFASNVRMAGRWHSNPSVSGGGVIIDNGTHSVDILRYLCGPISAVSAYEGVRIQDLPVEDTAHVVARTAAGTLASIDLSWSCTLENESYLRVYGTEGAITLGWARARYRHGSNLSWISFGSGYNKREALSAEMDNFCRAIRGEEELLITADDALASVQTIAAAYRSLRADQWVAVDGIERGETHTPELVSTIAAR